MIKRDGEFIFYRIQVRSTDTALLDKRSDGWKYANLDFFGHPRGFTVGDDCFVTIGIEGTFSMRAAIAGEGWMQKRWPEHKFRVVKVNIWQKTEVI